MSPPLPPPPRVPSPSCPACFESPKERQRVKLLLAGQEQLHPTLFSNILKFEHTQSAGRGEGRGEGGRTQRTTLWMAALLEHAITVA